MATLNAVNTHDLPTPPASEVDDYDVGEKTQQGHTKTRKVIKPAMNFASLLSGSMIEVVVGAGDQQRQWSIHEGLLIYHSPYFANQTQQSPSGSAIRVELLQDSPAAFEIFVNWLYRGTINDVSSFDMDKKWDYAFACQQLYHLAERLDIPQLKNAAIDQFRRGCHEAELVPGPEEMIPVYDNTPKCSQFRKLVSRIAARQIMDPESTSDASTYRECFERNADFAIDVINAIKAGMGGKLLDDPTELVGCEYHDHIEESDCSLRMRSPPLGASILKPSSGGSQSKTGKIQRPTLTSHSSGSRKALVTPPITSTPMTSYWTAQATILPLSSAPEQSGSAARPSMPYSDASLASSAQDEGNVLRKAPKLRKRATN